MQRLLLGLQTVSNQACEQIDDEVEWATMARLRAISFREASPLFNASWGQEAEYLIAKALWMAQQGQHQAALHVAWVHILIAAIDCLQRNNPVELVAGTDVMQRWLHRNSMHEPALFAEKIQGAEILLQQVEVLVNEIGGD